jgi:nitroreductase
VAPTGANLQPYKIIVIQSEEGMRKLAKTAKTCGAPAAFIICSDTAKAFKRPYDGKSMSDIDGSIVTDHMMLAAADLGLGSLWMTYFDPRIIRSEFNIPDNYEPLNILLTGYSDEKEASPDRHSVMRRKRSEVIVSETF